MENEQKKPRTFSREQAKLKAESFCAYQERAQQEVRNKLYEWGLYSNQVEQIISELIEDNFLNEERFAKSYVLGKFRIKKWGKIKIRQGLKLKKIGDKLISKSLNQIDGDDYIKTLETILEKKSAVLVEKDAFKKRYKLMNYALSKGFEKDLIFDVLKNNTLP
ncbi:MAG: regulatory protein RecX [Daejeonella sp.]